jgi:hypothetical protein
MLTIHPWDALYGLGLYLVVCLSLLLTGLGLLRLLALPLKPVERFALAPVLTMACWILVLGATGAYSIPIRLVTPWLWLATALLALCTIGDPIWKDFRSGGWVALCALIPVLGMCKAFLFGVTEYGLSFAADGWSSLAIAQYHWDGNRRARKRGEERAEGGRAQSVLRYPAGSVRMAALADRHL